jgi:outer membrane protein assembly factor BamD
VIAGHEFRVGAFYRAKGSNPAAANRLETMVGQYPLFSGADDALWQLADAYGKMGPRFREKNAATLARIVKDYPLSPFVEDAKKMLRAMEKPIPEPDPVALARMKYELENRESAGLMSQFWGVFRKSPDVRAAAKSGTPTMTSLRPSIPASVPVPAEAGATAGATADVTVSTITGTTALDTKPDARQKLPSPAPGEAGQAVPADGSGQAAGQEVQPLPSNQQPLQQKPSKKKKVKNTAKQ